MAMTLTTVFLNWTQSFQVLKYIATVPRLSHETHNQMNQTLRKSYYGGSCKQAGTPKFLSKKLYWLKTCVCKSVQAPLAYISRIIDVTTVDVNTCHSAFAL